MATLTELRLALQVVSFVDGFRKALRFEAQSYLDTLTRGTVLVNGVPTPALDVVQGLIAGNRIGFATSVGRYQTLVGSPTARTALVNGLAALGVALADATALTTALEQAVTAHATADISTDPLLRTMAASMLSLVPTFVSLIPEI